MNNINLLYWRYQIFKKSEEEKSSAVLYLFIWHRSDTKHVQGSFADNSINTETYKGTLWRGKQCVMTYELNSYSPK